MIHLSKFIHTKTGKLLMSILLGFGIATLFRKVCDGKKCIIYHAPPLEEIKDKTFKYDDKCYKFTTNNTKCDSNKKIVEFK
jgi:hypothetical protein